MKKKRKLKTYNIVILLYIIITFLKYAITKNPNILELTLNVGLDFCMGWLLYEIIKK